MSQTIMGVVIPDRCGQFVVNVQMDAPNCGFRLRIASGGYSLVQFIFFQDFRGGPNDQSWISNLLQEMALKLEKEIQNGIHRQATAQAAGGPPPPLAGGGFAQYYYGIAGGSFAQIAAVGNGGGGGGGGCGIAAGANREIRKEKPLPTEKILLGELTGYRGWKITPNGFLKSMSAGVIWAPGELMEGKPTTRNGADGYGIYAYKSAKEFLSRENQDGMGLDVYGAVSLWGEVVEHEFGYRAEWAKITELRGGISLLGKQNIKELRQTYGVA